MKTLIKKTAIGKLAANKLKGKKRYFAAAFIAVELASLPAAAHIVKTAAFKVKPTISAVEIPTAEAGVSRFIVVSNAPFTIRSADMVGDVDISIHQSGELNGSRFGDNAQLPGPASACAAITNSGESVIYQAKRKTAAKKGSTVSKAVVVEIKYDSAAAPVITFAKDDAAPAVVSPACASSIG